MGLFNALKPTWQGETAESAVKHHFKRGSCRMLLAQPIAGMTFAYVSVLMHQQDDRGHEVSAISPF
jgi:hypothetical protein